MSSDGENNGGAVAKAALVTYQPREEDRGDLLWDPAMFAHGQRVATMFAHSHLIPEHLRGQVADVTIGLAIARRIGEDPLTLLQSLYVVKGRPGWSAAYLIARAKRAGISIRWRVEERPQPLQYDRGTKNGKVKARMPDLTVTAIATLPGETEPVDYSVSSQQAIDAGWADNEQYTHSAGLMLRYRSATHLLRLYAPEILLGLPTEDEVRQLPTELVVVDDASVASTAPTRGLAAIDAVFSPPPSPSPTAAAAGEVARGSGSGDPASGGGQGAVPVAPPPPAGPTKAQREQAMTDATALRDLLYTTRSPGSLLTGENARASLRTAAKIARCSDDRFVLALQAGQEAGFWELRSGGVLLPDPLPGQESPPPAEAPTPDRWDALSGDALASELSELSIRVGDSACERASAAVGMAEAEVETASDDRIRELGRALDREEAALRADAGEGA